MAALLLPAFSLCAQDVADKLKKLLEREQYEQIIWKYASKSESLSAESLYYVGYAYFMKADDKNCLRFMNLSIDKYAGDARPYYTKATALTMMLQYEEAVVNFKTAIALDSLHAEYFVGLGDAYYVLGDYPQALDSYQKATMLAYVPERAFLMVAHVYHALAEPEKALEAFYTACSILSPSSDSYRNVLFNIGLLETGLEAYDKAEQVFRELIEIAPRDFHVYAKLVQLCYRQKKYEEAKPYKAALYEAYEAGLLEGHLEDMFCFDQFAWKDRNIQAYERFQDGDSRSIYIKHLFYVVAPNGHVEYKIQTEYSPIAADFGEEKYVLCRIKDNIHSTFGIMFGDDFLYDDLKKAVLDILDDKIGFAASSDIQ